MCSLIENDSVNALYQKAMNGYRNVRIGEVWANDWNILFHEATGHQERNEHNLMRDFKDEVPGYLNNRAICEALDRLTLEPGVERIGENLTSCYEKLVRMKVIEEKELGLLQAWIEDVQAVTSPHQSRSTAL